MSRADARPDRAPSRRAERRPLLAVLLTAAVVVAVGIVGGLLDRAGTDLHLLGGVVLRGGFTAVVTPGAVLPVVVGALGVAWAPRLAARLGWRALLAAAGAGAALWACALGLSGGLTRLTEPLASRYEYPYDVDRVGSLGGFLAGFTASVPADAADPWTTHVAGHPPGALLAFVLADRLGPGALAGGAALCIAVGASAVPAVLVAVRALADEATARGVAPFAVLAPTALVVATSADALFAGVAAWGMAALALAAAREPGPGADLRALTGGLLLGLALFLSFGLAALGLVALGVVLVQRDRLGGGGVLRLLAVGALGVVVVFGLFAAGGYAWFEGLAAAAERVRSGPSYADRPFAFFVFANLAAAAVVAGPAAVGGLAGVRRVPVAVLPLAALAGMLVSDLTGLVRGETERIWLPFTVWVVAATAFLPPASRRWWLAGSAVLAVVVEVFVRTEW
ncbi:hypothetical protein OF117_08335 [Geodermatophilus sp. YIM 151500]|uniref:hypothetical protein n=1 Tax=Geodermatophilus sp. YIM 151500 TaxID=2984531 RepID=UPI0021E4B88A|nr:hypothetical protein [Geodermatophilus sp. YIM 151500]MCV2489373.1 hypothetical protein [Geodermatophilus sp. YIM 151500]